MELAQLKYRAARLVGLRNSLSRLGGGIGTRGPGEKKLEMDRRLIRERISRLKKELREVEEHRERLRTQRKRSNLKVAALVGYTSAGKSSLEMRSPEQVFRGCDAVFHAGYDDTFSETGRYSRKSCSVIRSDLSGNFRIIW